MLAQARPSRPSTACWADGRYRLSLFGLPGRAVGSLVIAACTIVLLGGAQAPAVAAQLEPTTTLPATTTPTTGRTVTTTRRGEVGGGPASTGWTRPGPGMPGPPGPAGAAHPDAGRARPDRGPSAPGPPAPVRQPPARDHPPPGGLRRLGRVAPVRIARQLVWTSVDELRRLPPAPRLVVVLLLSLCLALTAMAGGMLWRVLRAWRTSP